MPQPGKLERIVGYESHFLNIELIALSALILRYRGLVGRRTSSSAERISMPVPGNLNHRTPETPNPINIQQPHQVHEFLRVETSQPQTFQLHEGLQLQES